MREGRKIIITNMTMWGMQKLQSKYMKDYLLAYSFWLKVVL